MEVPEHRKWMDERTGPDKKKVTNEFMAGVVEFIDFACAKENYKREGKLRCSCKKFKCKSRSCFYKLFKSGQENHWKSYNL